MAAVAGVEAAAVSLGLDRRTVRSWSEQAGRAPELVAEPDAWRRLHDLALARVTSDLVSGKMRTRDAAVVAAIARRNLTRVQEAPPEAAVDARDAFLDWAEAETGDTADALLPELLRRANEEDGQPHRRAMLAFFSGRSEIPAGDVLEWAQQQTHAVLAERGSLDGFRHWRERRRAEDHAAMLVQLERNADAAKAWQRASLGAAAVTVGEHQ